MSNKTNFNHHLATDANQEKLETATTIEILEPEKNNSDLLTNSEPRVNSLVDNTTKYLLIGIAIFTILMILLALSLIRNSHQNSNYSSNHRNGVFDSYFPGFNYTRNRHADQLITSDNRRKIEILANQIAIGDIRNPGYSEIILHPNSRLKGDINIGSGSVTIMENATLDGEIYSSGDTKVLVGNNTKIDGKIYTSGIVTIENNVTIGGMLEFTNSQNLVKIGNNVEIREGVKAYSDKLIIGNNFKTDGDIEVSNEDGIITIENNASIKGNLKNVSGDINIGNNNRVDGEIETDSNFVQGNNNRVRRRGR